MPIIQDARDDSGPYFGSLPLEILEAEEILLSLINNSGDDELDEDGAPLWPMLSKEMIAGMFQAVAGLQIGRKYLIRIGEYLDDEITEEHFHALVRQDFEGSNIFDEED